MPKTLTTSSTMTVIVAVTAAVSVCVFLAPAAGQAQDSREFVPVTDAMLQDPAPATG